ncbi:hypothetical protein [Synechococcus sp. UW179A]|uniref:hypothetical protein n=1 Tax=Synechococcus sp. UW179A TaxID=2575510 RepID=UPI0010BEBB5C|nr:hypothetical protein [Synechococcus sp. UW179A]
MQARLSCGNKTAHDSTGERENAKDSTSSSKTPICKRSEDQNALNIGQTIQVESNKLIHWSLNRTMGPMTNHQAIRHPANN